MKVTDPTPAHRRALCKVIVHSEYICHARADESHAKHATITAHDHITKALEFLPKHRRRVAVQAGGHIGMWPRFIAKHFEVVYTFEPDADNFRCLAHNAAGWNVYPFRACLGACPRLTELNVAPKSGSNQVMAGLGATPTMALDLMGLDALDLLALDVEGHETAVYLGGEETITRCQPVIVCEETGKVSMDGNELSVTTAHAWLKYREIGRAHV